MATAKKTAPAKKAAAKTGTAVAIKKPSGNIVSIREQLKAQVDAMAGRTEPASGITIRLDTKKGFQLPDGSSTDELEVVIVDFTASNKFYVGKFDAKNPTPPVCFAIGQIPRELVPSANSPDKQCNDCASCPMNEFGSDGNGKACKNSRVLAVLPPDAEDDTPIWLLNVSPGAIKGFDGYVESIKRTFSLPPIGVVTKVTMDPNKEHVHLIFSDPMPNENLEAHFPRQQEAQELLTIEPDVSRAAAPARTPARKAPARKAVGSRR